MMCKKQYPIQVNGKVRGTVFISTKKVRDKDFVISKAKRKVKKHIMGSTIIKEIFVPERIINFIIK